MPAFYTHYIFGRFGYHDMEEGALKEMVRRHKKAYSFGLSGPDIFFYFAPDQLLVHPTPGSRLHEERCGIFLRRMLREALALSGEERAVAISYLAGFIGHYALDVSCHPHVYAYIEEEAALLERGERGRVGDVGLHFPAGYRPRAHRVSRHEKTGIHFRYECAMDHYFLEHYAGKRTGQLHQRKMVYLTPKERRVIARLVAAAYNKTYDRPHMSEASVCAVLFFVRIVQRLIRDPRGRRERVLCPVEKFVYRHPFLAGLYVNDNCYGIGREEWEKMDVLFRDGRREYKKMSDALGEVVGSAQLLSEAEASPDGGTGGDAVLRRVRARCESAWSRFADAVGNRSYHTGMPL